MSVWVGLITHLKLELHRGLVQRDLAEYVDDLGPHFTCTTVGVKRNLTIQLDADLIRRAKVIAAERGTSASGLVTQQITELIEARDRYIKARESALEMMSAATDHGGH